MNYNYEGKQKKNSAVRVVLVSCSELSDKNGVVSFMRSFIEFNPHFYDQGIIVSAICGSDQFLNKTISNEVPISVKKRDGLIKFIKNGIKRSSLGALFLIYYSYVRRAKSAYKNYLKSERADIVFFQDIFCFYVASKNNEFKEKSIVIFHSGGDVLEQIRMLFPGSKHGLAKLYIERIFNSNIKFADKIITLSKSYKKHLNDEYGGNKFHSIYNTSSLNHNLPGNLQLDSSIRVVGKINLVCVGSAQFRKGYDLLISAIASLSTEGRERFFLHIAGNGDQLHKLQELCELNNIKHCVRFHGNIENPLDIYRSADIFCLPSRDEGLSISLLEAMSFGLPVFATSVGSIDEIFDSDEYIRVDTNGNSMKCALEKILNDEFDLKALGFNSKQIFDGELSNSKFIDHYARVFRDVDGSRYN